ncbi:MAG: hypothetical protein JXA69_21110, partial [Phycisphaerae bacterium]|nr:hypothetical protein [Phycisphaerae bacterium]
VEAPVPVPACRTHRSLNRMDIRLQEAGYELRCRVSVEDAEPARCAFVLADRCIEPMLAEIRGLPIEIVAIGTPCSALEGTVRADQLTIRVLPADRLHTQPFDGLVIVDFESPTDQPHQIPGIDPEKIWYWPGKYSTR